MNEHRLTYRGIELSVDADPRVYLPGTLDGDEIAAISEGIGNWLNGVDATLDKRSEARDIREALADEGPVPCVHGRTPILAGFPRPEPEYRYYKAGAMIYRFKDGRGDPEAILANRESDYWEECGGPREPSLMGEYPEISYSDLPAHAKDQVTNEGEFLVWFHDGLWVGHTKHPNQDVFLGSEATYAEITAAIEKIKERKS